MTRLTHQTALALLVLLTACSSDQNGAGGGAGVGGAAGQGGVGGAAGAGGSAGIGGQGGEGGAAGIRANFETSLHKTRAGQELWYTRRNNGIDTLIREPFDRFLCRQCHNPDDGTWAGTATCVDCHEEGSDPPKHLQSETCLGCHERQSIEAGLLVTPDVHAATYSCAGCHGSNDVHGNGTEYDTMFRPGAIEARCTDCHGRGVDGAKDPPEDAYHAPQHALVDCSLCHTEAVLSCVNCHLEDELNSQEKCDSGQFFNWKFVMKWDREGDDTLLYYPATLTSIKYNCETATAPCADQALDPKKTFAVFTPYFAHAVTTKAVADILATPGDPTAPSPGDSDGCAYCHGTENCEAILAAGDPKLKLVELVDGELVNPVTGLIPLPPDYQTRFSLDFVEWEEGPNTGCQEPPQNLVLFEEGPDLWQTGADTNVANKLELGRPLTTEELETFCPAP